MLFWIVSGFMLLTPLVDDDSIVKDFFAWCIGVYPKFCMFWVMDCLCWVIFLGAFDPEESEHWRGFAGILGQIVILLLDVKE